MKQPWMHTLCCFFTSKEGNECHIHLYKPIYFTTFGEHEPYLIACETLA